MEEYNNGLFSVSFVYFLCPGRPTFYVISRGLLAVEVVVVVLYLCFVCCSFFVLGSPKVITYNSCTHYCPYFLAPTFFPFRWFGLMDSRETNFNTAVILQLRLPVPLIRIGG